MEFAGQLEALVEALRGREVDLDRRIERAEADAGTSRTAVARLEGRSREVGRLIDQLGALVSEAER